MLLNARRFPPEGEFELILLAIEDITDRRRADAVATSEVRFRRLFEAARDGILLRRPRHAKDHRCEPFMVDLLGLSPRRARRQGTLGNRPARGRRGEPGGVRGIAADGDDPLRGPAAPSTTGVRREVEFVSNIYQENGHRVIQCNIRDITDRRRLEEERERLHRVAEEARARAEANEASSPRPTGGRTSSSPSWPTS